MTLEKSILNDLYDLTVGFKRDNEKDFISFEELSYYYHYYIDCFYFQNGFKGNTSDIKQFFVKCSECLKTTELNYLYNKYSDYFNLRIMSIGELENWLYD